MFFLNGILLKYIIPTSCKVRTVTKTLSLDFCICLHVFYGNTGNLKDYAKDIW